MSKIVYDVVVLPPSAVEQASIAVSQKLSALGTEFTLNSANVFPHLSLYMAHFDELDEVQKRLVALSQRPQLQLEAVSYNANDQGMCEVFYHKTPEVTDLQEAIISQLNPLRHGLRTKDPVGRLLADRLATTQGEEHRNLVQYGYDEVGSFFNPHITFTRFKNHRTPTPTTSLPPLSTFSGAFDTLALFEMGEHGTCVKEIARWPLTVSATR